MKNSILDNKLFEQLLAEAGNSPRKRSHHNIHTDLNEPVQRLCIGLQKGTYIRPHFHPSNNKWELMLVLKGTVGYVIFDQDGVILEKLEISAGGSVCGIEVPPNTWHSLFPLTDGAIIFEVKEGPFVPAEPSDFAAWAPAEGEEDVSRFLHWMERAEKGDQYPVSF